MATSKKEKLSTTPRVGRTPDLLRKGGPMKDKTKVIPRKEKYNEQDH